ncbi:hypothetical protein CDD83_7722 [Cordyceps sp. RAO-2017]|nr:hypothetical protein CDD83_7722 [Cordyceps sp. RAO-2017]
MASEPAEKWLCCSYCSACFQSQDLLEKHLEEYRLRAAELQECWAHANSCDTAMVEEENDSFQILPNIPCPQEGCKRGPGGSTGWSVRKHFPIHVPCLEVCLDCCLHISRNASQLFTHVKEHPGNTKARRQYIDDVKRTLEKLCQKRLLDELRSVPNAVRILPRAGGAISLRLTELMDERDPDNPVEAAASGDEGGSRKRPCLDSRQQQAQSNQPHTSEFTGNPESTNLSADNETWLNREREATIASYPYTAQKGKTSKMMYEITRSILTNHPESNETLQMLFEELDSRQIEDLHRTMFEIIGGRKHTGVDRHHLRTALSQLWTSLQASDTYILEGKLQLPRSTCVFMDIGKTGDLTVSVKVGRAAGLLFHRIFQPLTHLRYHTYWWSETKTIGKGGERGDEAQIKC